MTTASLIAAALADIPPGTALAVHDQPRRGPRFVGRLIGITDGIASFTVLGGAERSIPLASIRGGVVVTRGLVAVADAVCRAGRTQAEWRGVVLDVSGRQVQVRTNTGELESVHEAELRPPGDLVPAPRCRPGPVPVGGS